MVPPSLRDSRPPRPELEGDSDALDRLWRGEHSSPHQVLGAHPATVDGADGVVVRAFHPDATLVECWMEGRAPLALESLGGGVFGGFVPGARVPLRYSLRFLFPDGNAWHRGDPYRFEPTLGALDLHLFNEGTHRRLWEKLGSRTTVVDGEPGTAFAVWAPNATRVSVVGDFNGWDGRLLPMRTLGVSGIWELFVPAVGEGALYKYEIRTASGGLLLKTDPLARAVELPPATASCVTAAHHEWRDAEWMQARARRQPLREPLAAYEVHLGSWARVPEEGHRSLRYRELATRLVEHVRRLGFTHLEVMPLAEHAYYPSWGYQTTSYYAPTTRYGSADDLRFFVDACHQAGLGVILDWVPAHFPRDEFALHRFDGTALYEHEDPRRGAHPDWGTLIFNYGRNEVKNFLLANALYWLREFHFDGLRIDAVASMLYLDYSRSPGEWVPNEHGGRENLEAIELLRTLNLWVAEEAPGAVTIAEESTSWSGVTRSVPDAGLGFTFKWNMGWMHDTLGYFRHDPVHRKHHQDELTFAMLYERTERFVNALSHDEVVHGKGSLLAKMPGDMWQKLANLRLLYAYQWTRPGKKLLFMGSELAQPGEWSHDSSVDWHLMEEPARRALGEWLAALGTFYRSTPALFRGDYDDRGFEWIDCDDREQSVLSFVRRDGESHVVVALNFTPVPRTGYRIGAPAAGSYVEALSSDEPRFGGSGYGTRKAVSTEPVPWHFRAQSMQLNLPPLGALVLVPTG
ncbi:MAG: 1,4-alpha-glucan branching protein GlgB [Polyangiaceae bacterium]|nr:1,4-alpha-glucan branching protein GlgB [Polyangiaceae bacterium]